METWQAAGKNAPVPQPSATASTHVRPGLPRAHRRFREGSRQNSIVSVLGLLSLVVCLFAKGGDGAFSDQEAEQKVFELVTVGPHYYERVNKLYRIAKRLDLSQLTLNLGNMDLVAEHAKFVGGGSPLTSPTNAVFSKVNELAKTAEAQAMREIAQQNPTAAKQFEGVDVTAELSSLLMSRLPEIRVESTGSAAASALKKVQTFFVHLPTNREVAFNNFMSKVRTTDSVDFDRLLKIPPKQRVERAIRIARREAGKRVEEASAAMDKAKWMELLYTGLTPEFLVDAVTHTLLNPDTVQVSESSRLEEVRAVVAEAGERLIAEADNQEETAKQMKARSEIALLLPEMPLLGPQLLLPLAVVLVASGLAVRFWQRKREKKRRAALRKSREERDRDLNVDFGELLKVPLDGGEAKGDGSAGKGVANGDGTGGRTDWQKRIRSRQARKKYASKFRDPGEAELEVIPEEQDMVAVSASRSRGRQ